MFVAELLHFLAPEADDVRGLPHHGRGATDDDRDVSTGGVLDAGGAGAHRDVERRVGLLQRLGDYPQVVDVGIFSMEGEPLLCLCPGDNIQVLAEPLASLVHVDPDSLELLALVSASHAEVQSSAAENVQHGGFLGHENRIVEGKDDHRSTNANARRSRRNVAGEGEYPGEQAVSGEAMLAKPRLLDTKPVGQLDLL